MNYLAIDYGKKNIGLAWMQAGLDVVLPYGQVSNTSMGDVCTEVVNLVKREHIHHVLVGLPVGLDGKENENTKLVRMFVDTLKKKLSIPVDLVDERFSSRQADAMGEGVSRDEKAAMVMLQSYIDRLKSGG